MKKVTERTCMGCNTKTQKENLIRLIKDKDNKLAVDEKKNKDGRGAYVCNSEVCVKRLLGNKRLQRSLKVKVEQANYEEIRGVIFGKN